MTDILRPGQGTHLDDETICALLDGELGPAQQQAAVEHQRTCAACRQRATALGGVADLVGCFSPTPDTDPMESALAAALAAFDEDAGDPARPGGAVVEGRP